MKQETVLHFYGAARCVTGSCYLIESEDKMLIDCGMFQGSVEKRNYKPFPFNCHEIDCLIITHAHIDHIGLIPKLVNVDLTGKFTQQVLQKL